MEQGHLFQWNKSKMQVTREQRQFRGTGNIENHEFVFGGTRENANFKEIREQVLRLGGPPCCLFFLCMLLVLRTYVMYVMSSTSMCTWCFLARSSICLKTFFTWSSWSFTIDCITAGLPAIIAVAKIPQELDVIIFYI